MGAKLLWVNWKMGKLLILPAEQKQQLASMDLHQWQQIVPKREPDFLFPRTTWNKTNLPFSGGGQSDRAGPSKPGCKWTIILGVSIVDEQIQKFTVIGCGFWVSLPSDSTWHIILIS
jgi:hypothetical protein